MTRKTSRPTSTHNMGSAIWSPERPTAGPGPTTPNGTPAVPQSPARALAGALVRALKRDDAITVPGISSETVAARLVEHPAIQSFIEWVESMQQAQAREQARKARTFEDMAAALATPQAAAIKAAASMEPQGIPKGIKVNREGPTVEARPQMEGAPEIIVRARIGEDREGGETWQVDRARLAAFLRIVPMEGATINAYMEDLNENADLQALCLEAAWEYQAPHRPTAMDAIAAYQEGNRRSNLADPGGLY